MRPIQYEVKGDGEKENRGTCSIFHLTFFPDYNLSLQVLCCLLMHLNTAKLSPQEQEHGHTGNFFFDRKT